MANEQRDSRRQRPPILLVIGFLLAFAATVLTVVLTGIFVRAPLANSTAEPPIAPTDDAAPRQ